MHCRMTKLEALEWEYIWMYNELAMIGLMWSREGIWWDINLLFNMVFPHLTRNPNPSPTDDDDNNNLSLLVAR